MAIDIDGAFDALAQWHPVVDLNTVEPRSNAGIRRVQFIPDVDDDIEVHQEYEEGMDLNRGGLMSIEEEDPARKQAIFEEKLTEMAAHGYTNEELDAVRQVWSEYASQFTIGMPIGSGMDVPPLIIELKEGALPKHEKGPR